MVLTSKYSRIEEDGTETLLTVEVPNAKYDEMLTKSGGPAELRADILNTGALIMQKRIDIQEYLNQELTPEQEKEVLTYAGALAKQNKLIEACTDEACGYRDIQMRLAGGHRLSPGMEREIDKIRATLDAPTDDEIKNCIEPAMEMLGYISKRQYEYDKSRIRGYEDWKVIRKPVTGMDRETVLKKLGKK